MPKSCISSRPSKAGWWLAAGAILSFGGALALGSDNAPPAHPYICTRTPRFDPDAWECGQERFPRGASIYLAAGAASRDLAPGFFASADPEVSFDGRRVLFAGKPRRQDPWQIWEIPVDASAAPAQPHRIAVWPQDAIRPLYLPDGKIVYSRKNPQGYRLEVLDTAGGPPLPITYAPGSYLTCDVLHDGRVLFESAGELYTVYPDGSGVEAYRCDHGPARHAGRQMAARDIVFDTGHGLARFTPAESQQIKVGPLENGDFAGPVAEILPGEWLVSFRPTARTAYAIYRLAGGTLRKAAVEAGVQPVLLAPREVPLRFPSGLHDWPGANLLCLNAYSSKVSIVPGLIRGVRLYSQGPDGQPVVLGETPVEDDGSFFLHVPGDQPLRLELRDRAGRAIQGEHGWFWMRRGEQRVCTGCHAGPVHAPENAVPKVLLRKDVPVNMTRRVE